MEFKPLKLADIGAGGESESLLDEVQEAVQEIAIRVMDERYTTKGKISCTITVDRKGDAVVVDGTVKITRPAKRRKAVTGFLNEDGELVAQAAEQLPLLPPVSRIKPKKEEGDAK